ncbi:uncharacterized protein LOC136027418 [Artemia franciscana]|uniref:uncharacterized protein LOC136027418 n=1 Tax=Artemia franciscana TaxID=6661 RepID=UPI0032D9BD7F
MPQEIGKKFKAAPRNISENFLCLVERRRGLYKNCLSDRSYGNKRNVKNVERALKYELRRCEVEAMDKIAKDLEDAAELHNSKILYGYNGVCDKDGCDFASYRLGDRSYYGTGSNFKVDTSRKVTVVTQFITSDGTDNGDLQEIRRFYVQDGQRIENSFTNLPGLSSYDSITEDFCIESKRIFGDFDHHSQLGGLKEMGEALRRGVVLVFSLWTDHEANMLWLDSNYPVDANPSNPGVSRGPCPTDSGVPQDVENANPDATVRFSNIKFGAIGSTT